MSFPTSSVCHAYAVQYVLELGCLQSKDEVWRDKVLYLRE